MAQQDDIALVLDAALAEVVRGSAAIASLNDSVQNVSEDVDALIELVQGGGSEPVDLSALAAKAAEVQASMAALADATQAAAAAAAIAKDKFEKPSA